MDADCLIKLAKSKLKELVCRNFTVIISQAVKEVIDNRHGHLMQLINKRKFRKEIIGFKQSKIFI